MKFIQNITSVIFLACCVFAIFTDKNLITKIWIFNAALWCVISWLK